MRQAYPSDLTDEQWSLLADLFAAAPTGRPREVVIRDVVDAIFYVNRTGVQWRYLPHDYPRWDVVYSYFRKWGHDGTWDQIQQMLREGVRRAAEREPTPSMACVDSQSVKGTECGGTHGIDGHKKINGVKRHILVDTMGLLLVVHITAAAVTDAQAAREVFRRATAGPLPRLEKVLGDHVYGYEGLPEWTTNNTSFRLEISTKPETTLDSKGKKKFRVIKWRWVVERTFAWLGRYRRNSRDYEKLPQTSESMLKISGIQLMLRRLKPNPEPFVFHYLKTQEKQAK
jgi:putative transposase